MSVFSYGVHSYIGSYEGILKCGSSIISSQYNIPGIYFVKQKTNTSFLPSTWYFPSDTFCIAHVHSSKSGYGKREAYNTSSSKLPEQSIILCFV